MISPSVIWIVPVVELTASPEPKSLTKSPLSVMHLVGYRVSYRVRGTVRVRVRVRVRIRSASMVHLAFSARSLTVAFVASASLSMYGRTW